MDWKEKCKTIWLNLKPAQRMFLVAVPVCVLIIALL